MVEPSDARACRLATGLCRRRHAQITPLGRRCGTSARQGRYAHRCAKHRRLRARSGRQALDRGDAREPRERECRAERFGCAHRMGPPPRRQGRDAMSFASDATPEGSNQSPPLENFDAYSHDPWLARAALRANVAAIAGAAADLGRFVGSAEAQHQAALANRHLPELKTHDRYGNRIDAIEYHPSYHALMRCAFGCGLHSTAWKHEAGGFSARAVLFYLWNQLEQGTACPVTMTFASISGLEAAPEIAREWRPKVLADAYDPRPAPLAAKAGVTIGMAMTEKQGGSDLRAVQTSAERDLAGYRLNGHKWFCSAPMSD